MSSASFHIRVSPDLKQQFESTLDKIGLSSAEALRLFMRRVVAEQAIPFDLRVPNAETRKVSNDVQNKVGLIGPFHHVNEMMASLDLDQADDDDVL